MVIWQGLNNFTLIKIAKESCHNAGEEIRYHFPDVRKTIPMPKGACQIFLLLKTAANRTTN